MRTAAVPLLLTVAGIIHYSIAQVNDYMNESRDCRKSWPRRHMALSILLCCFSIFAVIVVISLFIHSPDPVIVFFFIVAFLFTIGLWVNECLILRRKRRSLWWIFLGLATRSLKSRRILTEEQEASGLYLEWNGQLIDLKREGKTLFTFSAPVATPDYMREEAEKFVQGKQSM